MYRIKAPMVKLTGRADSFISQDGLLAQKIIFVKMRPSEFGGRIIPLIPGSKELTENMYKIKRKYLMCKYLRNGSLGTGSLVTWINTFNLITLDEHLGTIGLIILHGFSLCFIGIPLLCSGIMTHFLIHQSKNFASYGSWSDANIHVKIDPHNMFSLMNKYPDYCDQNTHFNFPHKDWNALVGSRNDFIGQLTLDPKNTQDHEDKNIVEYLVVNFE